LAYSGQKWAPLALRSNEWDAALVNLVHQVTSGRAQERIGSHESGADQVTGQTACLS
jgi:hypothetical protein